ncbi:MAG: 1-acyl-sn-glycerol-3-phosphate acyltransferase [Muribaculaceae bacterium]|nr:1-acyl-sn-glycerol-3-phosphate acyltransferase [Muribaculaceae bacterium]
MNSEHPLIKIDLDAVLESRLGRWHSLIPSFLRKKLKRYICQDELNALLESNYPRRGAAFCKGVFSDLNIKLSATGTQNLPSPTDTRTIIVSNHPLGGLDGMALISFFTDYYGRDVLFVVNDLLMAIDPLRNVFLPVNKHGSQSRADMRALDSAMASDTPVIIFPAGLVSRRQPDGSIRDLTWQKMFVNKAIAHQRTIIPVHFGGHNSDGFYKLAARRARLGLKFNIEMLRLPSEVFKLRDATLHLSIGKPIPTQKLRSLSPAAMAAEIKDIVYSLSPNHT